jgi:hypothetical protein
MIITNPFITDSKQRAIDVARTTGEDYRTFLDPSSGVHVVDVFHGSVLVATLVLDDNVGCVLYKAGLIDVGPYIEAYLSGGLLALVRLIP